MRIHELMTLLNEMGVSRPLVAEAAQIQPLKSTHRTGEPGRSNPLHARGAGRRCQERPVSRGNKI